MVTETTLLGRWLEGRDISAFTFAKLMGIDPKTALKLINGQTLPDLITAFRIEKHTNGEVDVASWLETEHGRELWNTAPLTWHILDTYQRRKR